MYGKIFTQIFDSSIREKPEVRFTFMDLLDLAEGEREVPPLNENLSESEKIRLEQSLERIVAEIESLKDADIPKFVERRKELKAEKDLILGILGLKA